MRHSLTSIDYLRWCLTNPPRTRVDLRKWLNLKESVSTDLLVELSIKKYPIHFLSGSLADIPKIAGGLAKQSRKCALLTDQTVWKSIAAPMREILGNLPRLELPAGEKTKSLASLGQVLDFMAAERLDRNSVL